MNAVLQPDRLLLPMRSTQLDGVLAIEAQAYAFPWSRGNFVDSLAAHYPARVLYDEQGAILGYFVAMGGVDEMHLLNLTVDPAVQGRGHGRVLLDAVVALCQAERAARLWLEVRQSNDKARAMYLRAGFAHVGVRKGYYPAAHGKREDATVMSLPIALPPAERVHAVD
jgi:ribosomal-protein-alanine N-acetyltransferase